MHAFLQHWGIVNFNVDPDTCPGRVLPFPSVDPRVFSSLRAERADLLDLEDEEDAHKDLTSSEALMVNSVKVLSKNYRPVCDFCGVICGLVWYQ